VLSQELSKTADRVLKSYEEEVELHEVGNWQLLAAINALVLGDKTAANYHWRGF